MDPGVRSVFGDGNGTLYGAPGGKPGIPDGKFLGFLAQRVLEGYGGIALLDFDGERAFEVVLDMDVSGSVGFAYIGVLAIGDCRSGSICDKTVGKNPVGRPGTIGQVYRDNPVAARDGIFRLGRASGGTRIGTRAEECERSKYSCLTQGVHG